MSHVIVFLVFMSHVARFQKAHVAMSFLVVEAVSEIKVLFGAPTECTSPETVRLGISPCTLIICSYINWLKKLCTHQVHTSGCEYVHTGRRVHP